MCTILFYFDLGAARTYFKTRKNRHRKVSSGKQAATAAECRQRQRRHNVSVHLHTCLSVVLMIYFTESTCSQEGSTEFNYTGRSNKEEGGAFAYS